MEKMTIGEVSRRVGMRQSAIRYYEQIGLLPPPDRASGWRYFTADAVSRLQVIRTARDLGFTIEDISLLLAGFSPETPPSERWRALARMKLPQIDDLIGRALALRRLLEGGMRCECLRIEDCFLDDCSVPLRAKRELPIVTLRSERARPSGKGYEV